MTATPTNPASRRGTFRNLSAAVDRATVQVETAETMGDAATARAWRRVLRDLGQRVPESGR